VNKAILLWTLWIIVLPAQAAIEAMPFDDPAQESRYKALINELRCLVCQNQNLADSNADLAKDLRQQTYQMIRSGANDAEIIDYMVTRYGDFVLYRPPVKSVTLPLWIGPFVLLGVGVAGLYVFVRRRRTQTDTLSDAERNEVRRLLDQKK